MEYNQHTILVVEDDENFRSYLEQLLSLHNYKVITAGNGASGFEKANASTPDLIITDLQMPDMDGLELCNKVLANNTMSHIPIIILTGVDDETHFEKGLAYGAIDYITKPIKSEVLILKVRNILGIREKFKEKNWKHLLENTFDDSEISEDEEFLQSIYKIVIDKIGRYDFGVSTLASELNTSERNLYRKVKDLTGVPVASFIREIRLQRASDLLERKSVKTKRELARQVGFKSTKHFIRAFKKRFGMAPSI